MVEQKTQTQDRGIVGAKEVAPAPKQFGKQDTLADNGFTDRVTQLRKAVALICSHAAVEPKVRAHLEKKVASGLPEENCKRLLDTAAKIEKAEVEGLIKIQELSEKTAIQEKLQENESERITEEIRKLDQAGLPKGFAGFWHALTGKRRAMRKEMAAKRSQLENEDKAAKEASARLHAEKKAAEEALVRQKQAISTEFLRKERAEVAFSTLMGCGDYLGAASVAKSAGLEQQMKEAAMRAVQAEPKALEAACIARRFGLEEERTKHAKEAFARVMGQAQRMADMPNEATRLFNYATKIANEFGLKDQSVSAALDMAETYLRCGCGYCQSEALDIIDRFGILRDIQKIAPSLFYNILLEPPHRIKYDVIKYVIDIAQQLGLQAELRKAAEEALEYYAKHNSFDIAHSIARAFALEKNSAFVEAARKEVGRLIRDHEYYKAEELARGCGFREQLDAIRCVRAGA